MTDFMAGVDLDEETTLYSPSRITLAMNCMAKYYFRYFLGRTSPKNGPLFFGTLIHEVIEFDLRQKMLTGNNLPKAEMSKILNRCWEDNSEDVMFKDGEENELFTKAKNMLPFLVDHLANVEPGAVEERIVKDVPETNFAMQGYIDLQLTNGEVRDFKTKAKSPTKDPKTNKPIPMPAHVFQLSVYGWLITSGERDIPAQIDYIIKTKTPKIISVPFTITQNDMKKALNRTKAVVKAIETECWFPNYGYSLCSPKFCDHWDECHDVF